MGQKWVKNGSKMRFSRNDPGAFGGCGPTSTPTTPATSNNLQPMSMRPAKLQTRHKQSARQSRLCLYSN